MNDEVEYFRPWYHDQFNYPYIERKTMVETLDVNKMTVAELQEPSGYSIQVVKLKLQQS